jgi:hypothetical protein
MGSIGSNPLNRAFAARRAKIASRDGLPTVSKASRLTFFNWGVATPDRTVPYGTDLLRNAFPGTSCLATISLSLRDKSRSPTEAPHHYFCADGVRSLDRPKSILIKLVEGQTQGGGVLQQMRGSCSPESMSTTRLPPIRVFMKTKPGWSPVIEPMIAAFSPRGCACMAERTESTSSSETIAKSFPSLAT